MDTTARYDLAGGMIDAVIPIDIFPQNGDSFAGQAGLKIRSKTGIKVYPNFRLCGVEANNSKFSCVVSDDTLGLIYNASFWVDDYSDLIVSSADLRARSNNCRLVFRTCYTH